MTDGYCLNVADAGTYQPLKGKTLCESCRADGYCLNVVDAGIYDGGFTVCFNGEVGKYKDAFYIPCPSGKFFYSSLAATTL